MAQLYNYTPQQIAEMTREQQIMLLSDGKKKSKVTKFANYAEYQAWKRTGVF